MAASTSNPPTFLESCQLLSSSLSRLSTSLKSPSPSSTANLTSQVHQLIKDSFRGEWVQRDAMEEGERWKFDTRRSIVERQLDELIQSAAVFPADQEQQRYLEATLDLLLTFVELGYADETIPLTTLAGLFELRPISACEPLLGYIETRVERLTKDMEYQRGRGPILLRLLNDLLRRLPRSKSGPVILSGRILMLLSSVYPLGEKSGVNLRGNFNIGKGTVWEEEIVVEKKEDENVEGQGEEKEGDEKKEKVDKMEVEEGEEEEASSKENPEASSSSSFYPTFWSLQKFFNNPHLLFSAPATTPISASSSRGSPTTPLSTLHSSLLTVLTAFSSETKKEKDLSGSSSTSKELDPNGRTMKGKEVEIAESMIVGEKDEMDKTTESLEQYFFPKFLTSRNLLSLELSDPTFRLQLLLQTLILTQYLLSLTPSARNRAQLLPLTNASAFPNYVLSGEEEKKVLEIEEKSWKEIESMQGGDKVKRALETVLKRERNWTDWKLRSCLPFTKVSLDPNESSTTAQQKLKVGMRPKPKFPHQLGNVRLSRVWKKDLKSLEGFEPDVTDDEFDSIVREWRMTKKRIEMINSQLKQPSNPKSAQLRIDLEPLTIKFQALHFRALRSASTQYLRHFSKIGSGDLEKLLEEIEKERRAKEEEEEAREATKEEEVDVSSTLTKADEDEKEKAAIRLGDTPKLDREEEEDEQEEEKMKDEAGTPPPPTEKKEGVKTRQPGTPKRPRSDSADDKVMTERDTEMKDAKKQKL
ncbi:hypothetical protein JCM5353_007122 [Sporobolomyces roseus]